MRSSNERNRRRRENIISEIEFVAQLHKAFVAGAEACEAYMNKQAPEQPKNAFNRLTWQQVESQSEKGPYEQTKNDQSEAFTVLQKKLQEQNGFWRNDKYTYWFHRDDPDVIDRRAVT